jgi:hypothetical protein
MEGSKLDRSVTRKYSHDLCYQEVPEQEWNRGALDTAGAPRSRMPAVKMPE